MHDVAIDIGPAVLVQRRVENPMRTEAMLHAALDAGEEGGVAGWIDASVNLVTMIGGLARVKGLSDAQKAAAARYRSLMERALIGGARATDYTAVRVDVSPSGRDVVEESAAARKEYATARRKLGPFAASLVERVVCEEASVRELARSTGEGDGGQGMRRTRRRLFEAVDVLVDHFGEGKRRVRTAGDKPGVFVGEVSTRRPFSPQRGR